MIIEPSPYVNDFKSRISYAKRPRLGARDSLTKRTWKKCKNGKRKYGWYVRYHSPVLYALTRNSEIVIICSFETYTKIEASPTIRYQVQKLAKIA
jgi:hypothetical protein